MVAPPRVLRRLAEAGALAGVQAFSGAEVLDPLDRRVIEAASGRRVREIYMATEGLFGVGCPHGTLHLAEDVVRFEWEPVAGSRLAGPVITDLVRRTQPMIRYRMNDLLELDPNPCPCGLALQPVRRIEGRIDDCLWITGGDRVARMVTPDVVRNALVDADARIDDFRIVQIGPAALDVRLPAALPRDARCQGSAGALPCARSVRRSGGSRSKSVAESRFRSIASSAEWSGWNSDCGHFIA